jgi:hypothetical protein
MNETPVRPLCECGNPDASWYGDPTGRRTFRCALCDAEAELRKLPEFPEVVPQPNMVFMSVRGKKAIIWEEASTIHRKRRVVELEIGEPPLILQNMDRGYVTAYRELIQLAAPNRILGRIKPD